MQALEKILQEIEQRINEMVSEAKECEEMEEYTEAEVIDHTISGLNIATNIIRSHMEEDIPKKPITDRETNRADCPVCGKMVRGIGKPFGDWCAGCGQRLDWSDK